MATITVYRDVPKNAPPSRGKLVRYIEAPAATPRAPNVPSPLSIALAERHLQPGEVIDFPRIDAGRFDIAQLGGVPWEDALTLARHAARVGTAGDEISTYNALRERFERTRSTPTRGPLLTAERWLEVATPTTPRSSPTAPVGRDYTAGGVARHDEEQRTRRRVIDAIREAAFEGGYVEAEGDGRIWEMFYSADDPRGNWEGDYVMMPRGRPDQLFRTESPESVAARALRIFGPSGPERLRVVRVDDGAERIDPLAHRLRSLTAYAEMLLRQVVAAAREALPAWVPREAFDRYVSEHRVGLVSRLARRGRPSA